MKAKKEIFICQITDSALKVLKCLPSNNYKVEFVALEAEPIANDMNEKEISTMFIHVLKKLGYDRNPIIVSLSRNQATCRYLKVPTQAPDEIENIVSLQASRYLPYAANELITGFQIISSDKEGYSLINLVIAHKDAIERYIKIFKELKTAKFSIALSSYGLCNLYNYIKQGESQTALIIDIDFEQAELAIISSTKLLFSRSFKFAKYNPDYKKLLIEEINKTTDAYFKEVSKEAPGKIVVMGATKVLQDFLEPLNKQMTLPVEALSYQQQIKLSKNAESGILGLDYSFASLAGLSLGKISRYLNLLPQDMKKEAKNITKRKNFIRIILFLLGLNLLWNLAILKDLDNKEKYLMHLKEELNKNAQEANPLEEIEKRFNLLEKRAQKKPTSLELIYELHKIMPDEISLISISYEEDNLILLHGQTQELNSVFTFVSQLEKSAIFKNFNTKVRYATAKKAQPDEIIDFEIACQKK